LELFRKCKGKFVQFENAGVILTLIVNAYIILGVKYINVWKKKNKKYSINKYIEI
jgi:hypothetical protein